MPPATLQKFAGGKFLSPGPRHAFISTREAYLEIFEGDTASVNAHLALLAHIRGNLDARAEYIKRLPADKLNEVLEIIMRGI